MKRGRRGTIGIIAGAVVLGSIAAVTASRIVWTQERIPPASASAETVLRVYLRAAKAHECSVTEALTVPSGDLRSMAWCGRRIQSPFDEHPDLLGYSHIAKPIDDAQDLAGAPREECFAVDITETNMSGADPGAMPGWEFCLTWTPAGWRVGDEGYG